MMMSSRTGIFRTINMSTRAFSGGEWGSGAGKGGGSGGTIRESGGAFGKLETAREEEFFRRKQREQLDQLKDHFHQEIERHEKLIKEHQDAIEQSKKKISDLNKH